MIFLSEMGRMKALRRKLAEASSYEHSGERSMHVKRHLLWYLSAFGNLERDCSWLYLRNLVLRLKTDDKSNPLSVLSRNDIEVLYHQLWDQVLAEASDPESIRSKAAASRLAAVADIFKPEPMLVDETIQQLLRSRVFSVERSLELARNLSSSRDREPMMKPKEFLTASELRAFADWFMETGRPGSLEIALALKREAQGKGM